MISLEDRLIDAAKNGDMNEVEACLQKGANVNAIGSRNQWGNTALILAVQNGHKETVALLLKRGADANARGYCGNTALISAACRGHKNIVALLLEEGADVNAKDNYCNTALIFAAGYGQKDTVALLLEKGADVNAKENYGYTALSLAASHSYKDIVALLQQQLNLKIETNLYHPKGGEVSADDFISNLSEKVFLDKKGNLADYITSLVETHKFDFENPLLERVVLSIVLLLEDNPSKEQKEKLIKWRDLMLNKLIPPKFDIKVMVCNYVKGLPKEIREKWVERVKEDPKSEFAKFLNFHRNCKGDEDKNWVDEMSKVRLSPRGGMFDKSKKDKKDDQENQENKVDRDDMFGL